ncbi:hypothetical protein F-VV10_0208 [Faustovirus]|nr:hypothetical protein F-VV10_0208 [Faustovirus]
MQKSVEPIECAGYAQLIRVNNRGIKNKPYKVSMGYHVVDNEMVFSFPAIMNATGQRPKKNEYITPEDWESKLDWEKNTHWYEWEMRSGYGKDRGRPKYQVSRLGFEMLLEYFNSSVERMKSKGLKFKIGKIVHKIPPNRERKVFEPILDIANSYESDDEDDDKIAKRKYRTNAVTTVIINKRKRVIDDEEPAPRIITRSRAPVQPIEISDESSDDASDVEVEQIPADYRSSDEDNDYEFDDFVVPDYVLE